MLKPLLLLLLFTLTELLYRRVKSVLIFFPSLKHKLHSGLFRSRRAHSVFLKTVVWFCTVILFFIGLEG